MRWLYLTGLRAAEMCTVKYGDIQSVEFVGDDGGVETGWCMEVIGKGKRLREVVVVTGLMDELQSEMRRCGIDPSDASALLVLSDFSKVENVRARENDAACNELPPIWHAPSWSPSGLYKAVKRVLDAAAATKRLNKPDADRLRKASTHWIRHTHGTHGVASGLMTVVMMRDNLGHASVATTSEYLTSERDARMRAMKKFAARKTKHS